MEQKNETSDNTENTQRGWRRRRRKREQEQDRFSYLLASGKGMK